MAKKTKRRRTSKRQTDQAVQQRLSQLIIELLVAGTQVLIEEFGFTNEQARTWFQLMLDRVNQNRVVFEAPSAEEAQPHS